MPVGDLGRLQFLQHDGAEVGNDLRDDQLPVTFCGFAGQAAMPVDPFKQIFADRGLAGVGQGAGGGRGDQLGQLDLGVALCAFEAGIADLAVDGNATDRAACRSSSGIVPTGPSTRPARSSRRGSRAVYSSGKNTTTRSSASPVTGFGSTSRADFPSRYTKKK